MSSRPSMRQFDPPPTGNSDRTVEWIGVAWFTALFVLSIGVTNGASNQNSYLLLGLRLADPGFLPSDWFTWQTVHSHQVYGILVAALARLGVLHWGLALGTVIQNGLFAVGFYFIVRLLYERPVLPWAASLVLFSAMHTMSLGAAPWLKSFLGVSSMSGVAVVVGVALLARGRLIAGGIALGCAGLFHAHFVVLVLPMMVAVTVERSLGREASYPRRTIALFWLVFLAFSGPSLVQIIRFMMAPGAHQIQWLTAAVFPYHLAPWTWGRDPVLVLVGSVLLGAGGWLLRPPRGNRMLFSLLASVCLVVFISYVLARQQLLELAVQTWAWRLSPLVLLAGLSLGMAAILSPRRARASASVAVWGAGLGLLVVGIAIIAVSARAPAPLLLLFLILLGVLTGGFRLVLQSPRRWSRHLPLMAALLVTTLCFQPLVVESLEGSHVEFRPERPERAPLYEWIRGNTAVDAIHAMPPSWEGFRLNARRPIVVDWKAIPRYPPDRIEWLERMRALTGIDRPGADRRELDDGYAGMDCQGTAQLRSRYDVRYVVHERPKELACGHLVYEDEFYRVWELEADIVGILGVDRDQ